MDKNRKILYLSYDGMTDPLGQSQVLPYIIGLTKAGYEFHLISFEKKERFEKKQKQIQELCDREKITWHPIKYTKKPPVFSTALDIYKMNKKAFALHAESPFSIVHCRSYISALIGLAMKRKKGVSFIFDMRGFWADERVDGNIWSLKNPLIKKVYSFFKRKEIQFLQEADKIISLTSAGKDVILNWQLEGVKADKIEIIPCTSDFELFEVNSASKKKAAKEKLHLKEGQFVLSYIGSIGTWYMLDEMLEFFRKLKVQRPDAKFLILTGEDPDYIIDQSKKYNIQESDLIIEFVDRQYIASYIHASDASIFFIRPTFSKLSSSPTKMGELLAMGIPLICNAGVGDVESFVNENKVGFCLKDFSENSMDSGIDQVEELMKIDPEYIREVSKTYFQLENGVAKYLEVYNQLG